MNLVIDTFGIFVTDTMLPRIGGTYTLNIRYNNEEYKATAYLDTVPEIDSATYSYEVEYFFGFRYGYYDFRIHFYEPAPMGDCYRIDAYLNDTLLTDEIQESFYFDEFLGSDTYWSNFDAFAIPQEEIHLEDNVLRIEMVSVSREEYEFYNALMLETYANGSIFSGPPAMTSNFSAMVAQALAD